MTQASTQTYQENYAKLKSIATTLRQGETDIDMLIPMVEEAMGAFKVCKARIEAVSKALGEAMPEELKDI